MSEDKKKEAQDEQVQEGEDQAPAEAPEEQEDAPVTETEPSTYSLRLKMLVESVKYRTNKEGDIDAEEIEAFPVYGDEGSANAQWSKWTPSGKLTFTVTNKAAFGRVRVGQFFFVDLHPCGKDD